MHPAEPTQVTWNIVSGVSTTSGNGSTSGDPFLNTSTLDAAVAEIEQHHSQRDRQRVTAAGIDSTSRAPGSTGKLAPKDLS